jgi:uncharacterized Zn finger protein
MPDLDDWITREALEDYAGPAVFQRGASYFREGAVSRLRDEGDKVAARVHGTETYRVALWTDGDELEYDCTCPHAEEGNFCKHCVALGLAFLAGRQQGYEPCASEADWRAIRLYLASLPAEILVDWLIDAAERDAGLYRTLLLRAGQDGGAIDVIKIFRREIDNAARTHGFMDYEEARAFADDLDRLADALTELQTPETAALLVELAEYAMEKIARTLDQVEDADGEVEAVLERLQALHLDVCALVRPDPVQLAERLFRYEVLEGLEAFQDSLNTYREVLGLLGIRRFCELAEEARSAP